MANNHALLIPDAVWPLIKEALEDKFPMFAITDTPEAIDGIEGHVLGLNYG